MVLVELEARDKESKNEFRAALRDGILCVLGSIFLILVTVGYSTVFNYLIFIKPSPSDPTSQIKHLLLIREIQNCSSDLARGYTQETKNCH